MLQAQLASVILSLITAIIFKPKSQAQPPAGLNELKLPIAEDGAEIPVVFGCRYLRGANCVWYGDYRTTPIKVKGGKK